MSERRRANLLKPHANPQRQRRRSHFSHSFGLMDKRIKYATIICPQCQTPYLLSRILQSKDFWIEGKCRPCYVGRGIAYCLGVGSQTSDGRHVLMFDFDFVSYDAVYDALALTQRRWHLSHIHVFESSPGSYQAICFDKYSMTAARKILSSCPKIDEMFLTIPDYRDHFTLRVVPKRNGVWIKYVGTLLGWSLMDKSFAHYDNFGARFPIVFSYPIDKHDSSPYIFVDGYRSRHIGGDDESSKLKLRM